MYTIYEYPSKEESVRAIRARATVCFSFPRASIHPSNQPTNLCNIEKKIITAKCAGSMDGPCVFFATNIVLQYLLENGILSS